MSESKGAAACLSSLTSLSVDVLTDDVSDNNVSKAPSSQYPNSTMSCSAQLPREVFRGKGILWIEETDKQYIFHLVGTRFTLDERPWIGHTKNRLVLIGRGLNKEGLHSQLEACLARPSDFPHRAKVLS